MLIKIVQFTEYLTQLCIKLHILYVQCYVKCQQKEASSGACFLSVAVIDEHAEL